MRFIFIFFILFFCRFDLRQAKQQQKIMIALFYDIIHNNLIFVYKHIRNVDEFVCGGKMELLLFILLWSYHYRHFCLPVWRS